MLELRKLCLLAPALALATLPGCSAQSRGDYDNAGKDLGAAARETGKAIKNDTMHLQEQVEKGSSKSGESMKGAPHGAGNALKNDKTSGMVSMVLSSRPDIHISGLKVDTKGSVVILRGTAATAHDKAEAGLVTKSTLGPNYMLDNELHTGGG